MTYEPEDLNIHWLDGLKQGDSAATQQLWDRYFSDLVKLAEQKLQKLTRDVSGEDVALSAMKSVMIGIQRNRFPNLTDPQNLWPLLVTITARKSIDQLRRQMAGKRSSAATFAIDDLHSIIGDEPTPEFAIAVADQLEDLLKRLGDASLNVVAMKRLEGYTIDEIAVNLSVSRRTVLRKLKLIRQAWLEGEIEQDEL